MLRTSCVTLEVERFGCYKTRIEESKNAGSHWESNLGHRRILEVVRAGGCLVVIAADHWQLKPGALGLIPNDFSCSFIFASIFFIGKIF